MSSYTIIPFAKHGVAWAPGTAPFPILLARWLVAKTSGKALGSQPQSTEHRGWEKTQSCFLEILHKSSRATVCAAVWAHSSAQALPALFRAWLTFFSRMSSCHVRSMEQTQAEPRPGHWQPVISGSVLSDRQRSPWKPLLPSKTLFIFLLSCGDE